MCKDDTLYMYKETGRVCIVKTTYFFFLHTRIYIYINICMCIRHYAVKELKKIKIVLNEFPNANPTYATSDIIDHDKMILYQVISNV